MGMCVLNIYDQKYLSVGAMATDYYDSSIIITMM